MNDDEYANGRLHVITELGLWCDENKEALEAKIESEKSHQAKLILKGIHNGFTQFQRELNRKILRMQNNQRRVTETDKK